jgi:hypothetical protein
MLRGIPVLASDYGGLVEAKLGTDYLLPVRPIQHFEDTLDENMLPVAAVPEQDLGPWRDALTGLLADRALHERQSAAARDAALKFVSGLGIEAFEDFLFRLSARPRANRERFLQASMEQDPPGVDPSDGSEKIAGLTPEQQALLILRLRKQAANRPKKD